MKIGLKRFLDFCSIQSQPLSLAVPAWPPPAWWLPCPPAAHLSPACRHPGSVPGPTTGRDEVYEVGSVPSHSSEIQFLNQIKKQTDLYSSSHWGPSPWHTHTRSPPLASGLLQPGPSIHGSQIPNKHLSQLSLLSPDQPPATGSGLLGGAECPVLNQV